MSSETAKGEIILTIPKVMLIMYDKKNHTSKIHSQDNLEILYYPNEDSVIINHGKFNYALNANIPIYTNNVDKKNCIGKKYFLPAKDQVFGLVFGDDVPIEDQNNLENIFQENSELVFPDCEVAYTADGIEVRTEVETATKGPRVETEKGLQAQEGMNPNDASKGLGNMLTKGGDVLKDGISSGGEYVGKGIKKTKGFLKNQFGKNEAKKEVSETTIQKLRMANKATVKIKEYTIGGIKNLMDFAIGLGKDAAEEIGQMKDADGQKHEDNKYWIHGKNIGTGVQHVAGGIWAGLTEVNFL